MQHSRIRVPHFKIIIALLALAICTGTAQASGNVLTASATTVNLTCSTVTGPSTGTVTITLASKPTASLAVGLSALPAGIGVTPPSGTLTTSNYSTGIAFTVTMTATTGGATAGCVTIPASGTFHFTQGASSTQDVGITVNTSTNSTTSGLVVKPSAFTVTCTKTGSTYTPSAAQTVSITSAATNGGTPFTMTPSTVQSWLTLSPAAGSLAGTANTTPTTFTVAATPTTGSGLSAVPGCGGYNAPGTYYDTIHLVNAPAPDQTIAVTMQVVAQSNLTVTTTPSSGALTYVKGSGTPGYVDVAVTAPGVTPAPFVTVDTTTLPIWMNSDSTSGTVPKSFRFSSNSVADTLAPGNYSASVNLNVSGHAPQTVNLSLLVTNSAPKLSIKEGPVQNITWQLGQGLPTPTLTLVSSDSPISYSLSSGGVLAPVITASEQSGLAYSFGTPIPVTFNPTAFAAAIPGNMLTGTITITWGPNASTTVETFNVTVVSPGATLSGISPASIPTEAAGGQAATVVLSGTGFVTGTDPTVRTNVGIVASGSSTMAADSNIAVSVASSSIVLTITIPATNDTLLPFTGGGNVTLGVCNPVPGAGSTCNIPTATVVLTIGANPIISAVTSASKFQEVSGTTLQTVAPYDLISIFGSNFCPPCSSTQVLQSTPDATTKVYPSTLSPDSTGATQRNLAVTFYQHGTTTLLGTAPLLFATNNQINLAVPSGVSAQVGNAGGVDIVVTFGYGTSATTLKTSTAYQVTAVATNPGIFTIGADGQGEGAALDKNWATISQTNPAGMRSTATDSDTIQVFMTGLGVPDSQAADTSGGSNTYPTDCVKISNFLSALSNQTSTTVSVADGAIIQSALIDPSRSAPCIATTNVPTATVGGQPATVTYAGWVEDSIAGLYQINLKLPGSAASIGTFTTDSGTHPTSITGPVQLPVSVTAGSQSSQANVLLWVEPMLLVAPPANSGLSGNIGASWPASTVSATEGTPNYQYIVSSGVLPSGLTLNGSSGAIAGVPALNTSGSYIVTVNAMDSATPPVTGTVTFTLTVNGGLLLTSSTIPAIATSGVANTNVTTVTAAGGTASYSYSLAAATGSPALPAGMTIVPTTGAIQTLATTPAWTGSVTVTATDSGAPQLTGSTTFPITISAGSALTLTSNPTTPNVSTSGTANTNVATVQVSGGVSPYAFAPLTATNADTGETLPAGLTIDSSSGVIQTLSTTPAWSGSVTVTATDNTSGTHRTGTLVLNITINAAPPLGMTSSGSFAATAGNTTAVATVTASGGSGTYTYTYAITSGQAHSDLSLATASNVATISGTAATQAATYHVTVTATDSTTGQTGILVLSPIVFTLGSLTLGNPLADTGTVNGAAVGGSSGSGGQLAHMPSPTGGTGPYHFSMSPLDPHLTMDGSGNINYDGYAETVGPLSFTVTATDATSPAQRSGSIPITIQIQ